jgi:hypothetical protein
VKEQMLSFCDELVEGADNGCDCFTVADILIGPLL